MKKQRKCLIKLFFSFVMVLSLCVTSFSTTKVYATEGDQLPEGDSETVSITIDNSISHLAIQFYPDTNDMENFVGISEGATETIIVSKDSVARMRLFIRANGHCVPDDYAIEGATRLTDDEKVNYGWCRAAFTITADETKTIVIPEASVCEHPYANPSVRWGYYDCGDGTHAQSCTLCASDIEGTIANHILSEMTPTEYADWYFEDSNFANMSEEDKALRKTSLIENITGKLGVDADTKINCCTICEHFETIEVPDETPEVPSGTPETPAAPSETPVVPSETPVVPSETPVVPSVTPVAPSVTPVAPSETPVVPSEIATSVNDTTGVLPEGTTITATSVMSGDTYEKAAIVVEQNINGLGQYAVMEINLADASNVQLHELNGYIQVTIPVPSNINVNSGKTITVYRLEDDGSLTRCETTVNNGMITFSTNHFSTYIVVEETVSASPKTGDISNMGIYMMMFLLTGTSLVLFAKKKREMIG